MILGLVGVLALLAIGLPALWHQPDTSGPSALPEALASGDVMKEAVQEHLDVAKQHDKNAEHHEEEAKRYEQKAAAITPLMDTKGFRRDGMKMAAESHSSMASEFRFRAKVHRLEAELLMEKAMHAGKEK
jgi:galactokinase